MSFGKSNVIPTYSSTSTSCVSPKNKDGTKKSLLYTCVGCLQEWIGLVLFLRIEASVHMKFFHEVFGTCLGNLQECRSSLKSCFGFVESVLSLGHVLNVFHTMSFRSSRCQMALEQLCEKKRYFRKTT